MLPRLLSLVSLLPLLLAAPSPQPEAYNPFPPPGFPNPDSPQLYGRAPLAESQLSARAELERGFQAQAFSRAGERELEGVERRVLNSRAHQNDRKAKHHVRMVRKRAVCVPKASITSSISSSVGTASSTGTVSSSTHSSSSSFMASSSSLSSSLSSSSSTSSSSSVTSPSSSSTTNASSSSTASPSTTQASSSSSNSSSSTSSSLAVTTSSVASSSSSSSTTTVQTTSPAATTASPSPTTSSTSTTPSPLPSPAKRLTVDPSGTDGPFSGWGTWFDVGLGACGKWDTPDQPIIALSAELFDNWPGYNGWNPNEHPMCGKHMRITWGGKSALARVADRCPGCAVRSLDMSKGLFEQFASLDVGLLGMDSYTKNITWSWVEGDGYLPSVPYTP